MPPEDADEVVGVLLAGGQSRRMGGGDKCLRMLGGVTLLAHVIARARPQVGTLLLNANGDPGRFAEYELPIVPDALPGFAGPLAGVLTGMEWSRLNRPGARWIATFATDAPFLPEDLVARLRSSAEAAGADLACATSGGRAHPVFGLWLVRLADALREAMTNEGMRKIDAWTARYRLVHIDYPIAPNDPFFNANKPQDLAAAERWLA